MASTTIIYEVEDRIIRSSTKRLNALFAALAQQAGLSGKQIDEMFRQADDASAQSNVKATEAGIRKVGEEAQRASASAKQAGDTIEKESQQGEKAVEETT